MGFRINTNIAAMNAHNNATMNNRNMDDSLSRLSSGLRITKAADDASGLVIADQLRTQASSLGQAVKNGNDAISLIQTADGALDEYSKILDTIKTKSVQAASDGQNTNSRLAIQKDIDRLMEELDNIASTTSYNGQQLLGGGFTNKEFQIGANSNETVKTSIASAETTKVGHTTRSDLEVGVGTIQLTMNSNLTGESVQMKSVDIQYNNDPKNGLGALAAEINRNSGDTGIRAQAIVESTSAASVSAGSTGADFAVNGVNIGAVVVEDNDNSGTLLAAINGKTTETGVTATLTSNGALSLTSNDGRAIEVTGGVSGVLGSSGKDMSTVGHIELVQAGASEFQVLGVGAGATGATVTSNASTSTVVDSKLAAGSIIAIGSDLKAGTTIGGDVVVSAGNAVATTLDAVMKSGTTLLSATSIEQGSSIGGLTHNNVNLAIAEDMLLTAGSTLLAGSILGAGTILQQDFVDNGTSYSVGQVLSSALTLSVGNNLTLTADMTLNYVTDGSTQSQVAASSSINTGSIAGADLVTTGSTTMVEDTVLKAGSLIISGSTLKAGSTLGRDTINNAAVTTSVEMDVKAGTVLTANTQFAQGSTIGAVVTANADFNLKDDMTFKAGSILAAATVLKAGTVVTTDLTAAQSGAAAISAGTQITSDVTLGAAVTLSEDMTLLRGNGTTGALIKADTQIAINTDNSGSVGLSNTEFQALANIDVTTLEGAMKAMDTVDSAIKDLDSIRADLGSVQNQVVSTINNISVTQVNVKAAESQIRDVDFAAESANFSKLNILAQSGSYAMSQANAAQQNVLRLLQ